jgi:hypothetical protein
VARLRFLILALLIAVAQAQAQQAPSNPCVQIPSAQTGGGGAGCQPVTQTFRLPVTVGPTAVLGSYSMGLDSGVMAAGLAGGSPVISFRYGGSNLAIVRKVTISAGGTATAFTAGVATFDLFAARAFTASDTGGTAATLTTNNGKLRTSFATTAISDFRISSTAALAAGTRTLDATQLASVSSSVPATAGTPILVPTSILDQRTSEQPLTLATNEGFVMQATVPATGTWTLSVTVSWDEVLVN